jgi:hypothetical protein
MILLRLAFASLRQIFLHPLPSQNRQRSPNYKVSS